MPRGKSRKVRKSKKGSTIRGKKSVLKRGKIVTNKRMKKRKRTKKRKTIKTRLFNSEHINSIKNLIDFAQNLNPNNYSYRFLLILPVLLQRHLICSQSDNDTRNYLRFYK